MKNILLVSATLIAMATYAQAGSNPRSCDIGTNRCTQSEANNDKSVIETNGKSTRSSESTSNGSRGQANNGPNAGESVNQTTN